MASHNDIQECNFLVHLEDTRRFTLIDFDYASFNFRGFDLAGYSNECQLDNNFEGGFPHVAYYEENAMTPAEETAMLQIYLEREWEIKLARRAHAAEQDVSPLPPDPGALDSYLKANLGELATELKLMKTMAHLFWGVWALATVPVERREQPLFNYHFSLTRLDGYNRTVAEL